jgi:hypothetical protein
MAPRASTGSREAATAGNTGSVSGLRSPGDTPGAGLRPRRPSAVRLRASLAILQAADAIAAEEIGPTSAEGVRAKIEHDEFIESLGG